MVFYMDRLCSLYPSFVINSLTCHRFLITAATVATKGLSDSFWNNSTYARIGGLRPAELGLLEYEFLYRVDWRIIPADSDLMDYYKGLIQLSNDDYEMVGQATGSASLLLAVDGNGQDGQPSADLNVSGSEPNMLDGDNKGSSYRDENQPPSSLSEDR